MSAVRRDAAAEKAIAENVTRWLRFIGWKSDEVLELQALEVPDGRYTVNMFAHATTPEDAIRLLVEIEQRRPMGVYWLMNQVDPSVARRAKVNTWHAAPKGKGGDSASPTTDNDIVSRRVLLVDCDPKRARGTSATDAELEAAVDVADRIHARLVEILGTAATIALGRSGNGAAPMIALDSLENPKSDNALVKAILTSLDFIYATSNVKVDCSVIEPKRICAAWGTMKRKGDDNPDYPHRRTSCECADVVEERVGRDGLKKILAELRRDLTDEQRAAIDKIMGIKPAAKANTNTSDASRTPAGDDIKAAFTYANNELDPDAVLDWLGVATCPNGHGGGGDTSFKAYIGDKKRGVKCYHDSCASRGLNGYETLVDVTARVKVCTPVEALRMLGDHFGFDVPAEKPRCGAIKKSDGKPCGNTELLENGRCEYHQSKSSSNTSTANTSADEWPTPIPFTEFDLPPFPVDALPEWLREYVIAEATATQTPPDLTAMMSLAVCGAALAKKVVVQAREGWIEPVNLYVVCALPPASRKSAVIRDVGAPLVAYEEEKADDMRAPIARALQKQKINERTLSTLTDKAAKATSSAERKKFSEQAEELALEMEQEQLPRAVKLLTDDATPETVVRLMSEHDGRIAVLSPEGGPFEMMAGRYSKTPNFEAFLKGHPGDEIRVDRMGRAPLYVKRPAITLALAVQPDVIHGLTSTPGFRGRGLLGRFLYSLPSPNIGTRAIAPPPVPAHIATYYAQHVTAFCKLDVRHDARGNMQPIVMKLSPEASFMFQAFEGEIERRLGEDGDLAAMQDWGGKLCGAILRIVGILGLNKLSRDPSIYMGESNVRDAITIGRYLIEHARAAYSLMGADAHVENARHLLRVILRRGWQAFTERDLYQQVKGDSRFRLVETLVKPLSILVDRGYIRAPQNSQNPQNGPGRKPSPIYEVNPAIKL